MEDISSSHIEFSIILLCYTLSFISLCYTLWCILRRFSCNVSSLSLLCENKSSWNCVLRGYSCHHNKSTTHLFCFSCLSVCTSFITAKGLHFHADLDSYVDSATNGGFLVLFVALVFSEFT